MTHRIVLFAGLLLGLAACSDRPLETLAPESSALQARPSAGTPPGVEPITERRAPDRTGGLLDFASDAERGAGTEERVDFSSLSQPEVAALLGSVRPRYRYRAVNGYPGLYEFAIFNTGSGYEERFLFQTPPVTPATPAPLVVVFHKYGASHGDLLNSGFIPEVRARGWYALCPLGAQQKNFGSLESQINTRVSINLVRQLFRIDPLRIYGVGFSMGGGAAASYAARHLDPKGTMFAAVCDHTGGVSLSHTWWSEYDDNDADDNVPNPGDNLEVPDVMEGIFGGTPVQRPFDYQRCSTIELDPFTGQVGPGTDLARNLEHIPVLVWRAANDPLAFLVNETDTFSAHLTPFNVQHHYQLAAGAIHAWTTLDPVAVCNWLATKSLALPTSGRTIADEDGQWFYFFVEQDAFGSLTPFTWSVDAAQKRIEVSQTRNLRRLRLTPAGYGLVLSGAVTVRLSTADGSGDEFQFLYVQNPPVSVTRDGVAANGVFDPVGKRFTIVETDPALHEWVVSFP